MTTDDLDDDGGVLDDGLKNRLKAENKKYRQRAQEAEAKIEAMGPLMALTESDQAAVMSFASLIANGAQTGDFNQAAELAVGFARELAGDGFDELIGGPAEEPAVDEGEAEMAGLTKEDVQQMLNDAFAQQQAIESEAQMIARQLESLGYNPDPTDPKTNVVLSIAAANGGDLDAAHATVENVTSGAGASDGDDAAGAAGTSAGADGETEGTAPPEGVASPGETSTPTTFEEAEASALSKLDALADAGAFDD